MKVKFKKNALDLFIEYYDKAESEDKMEYFKNNGREQIKFIGNALINNIDYYFRDSLNEGLSDFIELKRYEKNSYISNSEYPFSLFEYVALEEKYESNEKKEKSEVVHIAWYEKINIKRVGKIINIFFGGLFVGGCLMLVIIRVLDITNISSKAVYTEDSFISMEQSRLIEYNENNNEILKIDNRIKERQKRKAKRLAKQSDLYYKIFK